MSEELSEREKEIVHRVEAELQAWVNANVIGKMPVNDDTVAALEFQVSLMLAEVLPEGYTGELMNARVEGDDIVSDGIRIRPKESVNGEH